MFRTRLCEGVRPNSGERGESVGGTFGKLILVGIATYQMLLECNHSKALHFTSKKSGNE